MAKEIRRCPPGVLVHVIFQEAEPARLAVFRGTPRVAAMLASGAAPARGDGPPGGDAHRGGVRAPRGRAAAVRGPVVVVALVQAGSGIVAGVVAGALVLLAGPGTCSSTRPLGGHRGGTRRCQGHVEAMQRVQCRRRPGWKDIHMHERWLRNDGGQRLEWSTQRANRIDISAAICQRRGRPLSSACLSIIDKP